MRRLAERAMREFAAVFAAWALVVHLLAMGFVPPAHALDGQATDICLSLHDAGASDKGDSPAADHRIGMCCILCGAHAFGPPPEAPAVQRDACVEAPTKRIERTAEPDVERHERAPIAPRAPPVTV